MQLMIGQCRYTFLILSIIYILSYNSVCSCCGIDSVKCTSVGKESWCAGRIVSNLPHCTMSLTFFGNCPRSNPPVHQQENGQIKLMVGGYPAMYKLEFWYVFLLQRRKANFDIVPWGQKRPKVKDWIEIAQPARSKDDIFTTPGVEWRKTVVVVLIPRRC